MSEPDNAEIGRRIAGNSVDNIEDATVACCAATGTARKPDVAQHQAAREFNPAKREDDSFATEISTPSSRGIYDSTESKFPAPWQGCRIRR